MMFGIGKVMGVGETIYIYTFDCMIYDDPLDTLMNTVGGVISIKQVHIAAGGNRKLLVLPERFYLVQHLPTPPGLRHG